MALVTRSNHFQNGICSLSNILSFSQRFGATKLPRFFCIFCCCNLAYNCRSSLIVYIFSPHCHCNLIKICMSSLYKYFLKFADSHSHIFLFLVNLNQIEVQFNLSKKNILFRLGPVIFHIYQLFEIVNFRSPTISSNPKITVIEKIFSCFPPTKFGLVIKVVDCSISNVLKLCSIICFTPVLFKCIRLEYYIIFLSLVVCIQDTVLQFSIFWDARSGSHNFSLVSNSVLIFKCDLSRSFTNFEIVLYCKNVNLSG